MTNKAPPTTAPRQTWQPRLSQRPERSRRPKTASPRSEAPVVANTEADLDLAVHKALPRTSGKRMAQLQRLGIETVRDLIFHLPRDYADRREITPAGRTPPGPNRTVDGYVTALRNVQNTGPQRQTATVYDTLDDLRNRRNGLQVVWYGRQYLTEVIRNEDRVTLSGSVTVNPHHGGRQLHQPDVHLPWQDDPNTSVGVIAPIYRLTQGLRQEQLRRMIHQALTKFAHLTERSRPGRTRHTMEHILWALHFPKELNHPELARHELASDEVLELQMALLKRRAERRNEQDELELSLNPEMAGEFVARLPYALTESQGYAIEEIRDDLSDPAARMHRLLQGEVGSGKTVVALHAIIDAISAQSQAVLLAPTEILAEQHHKTITELLRGEPGNLGPGIMQSIFESRDRPVNYALLTARTRATTQRRIRQNLSLGTLDFVIGTHSVINDEIEWKNLGLAVADEQHRFGTEQRAALRRQANYLMLTATPIPRTLQLTLYQDLDVSSLEPRPDADRAATKTALLGESREPAYQAIRKAAAKGRQAFVIAPFIDPNESMDAASVTEMYRQIRKLFGDLSVDMVHGQMKSADIERRMKAFRDGKTAVLVATSIIEVGIDVPNATVMLIESAERFGMAQLHQLRGRIGRGEHPGQCFLATTPEVQVGEHTMNRLRTVQESSDGMVLAQADLANRGEGNVVGVQQSGPGRLLRTGNAYDLRMLERQREIGEAIHEADSDLSLPEHQALRRGRERMLRRMDQYAP